MDYDPKTKRGKSICDWRALAGLQQLLVRIGPVRTFPIDLNSWQDHLREEPYERKLALLLANAN